MFGFRCIVLMLLLLNISSATTAKDSELFLIVSNRTESIYDITCLATPKTDSVLTIVGPSPLQFHLPPMAQKVNINSSLSPMANDQLENLPLVVDERWNEFETKSANEHLLSTSETKSLAMSIRSRGVVTLELPQWTIKFTNLESDVWYHVRVSYGQKPTIRLNNETHALKMILRRQDMGTFNYVFSQTNRNVLEISTDNPNFSFKLHKYDVLWWDKEFETTQIGTVDQPNNCSCLSFYVSACSGCWLTVKFFDSNSKQLTQFLVHGESEKWHQKRVILEPNQPIAIFASGGTNNTNASQFWAIDHQARACDSNNYLDDFSEVVVKNVQRSDLEKYTCFPLMEHSSNSIKYHSILGQPTIGTKDDNLGKKHTYSYKEMVGKGFKFPANKEICEQFENDSAKCYNFKFKCNSYCIQLEHFCDQTTGDCLQCKNLDLKPPDCVVARCPKLEDDFIKIHEIGFQLFNFTVALPDFVGRNISLEVKYKNVDEEKYAFLNNSPIHTDIVIEHLLCGTEYEISVKLHVQDDKNCVNEEKKEYYLKTKCDGRKSSNDFLVQSAATNATIKLIAGKARGNCDCPLTVYHITNQPYEYGENNTITIKDLRPNQKYALDIKNAITNENVTINFRTYSKDYPPVRNFTYITKSNTLVLAWNPPDSVGDDLEKYLITYEPINNCTNSNKSVNADKPSVILSNLEWSTSYEIQITSIYKNNKTGNPFVTEAITADDATVSDIDVSEDIKVVNDTLQITYSCKYHPRRKATYVLESVCFEKWCNKDVVQRFSNSGPEAQMKLTGLFPYTNYNATFTVRRFNKQRKNHFNFTTLPQPPKLDKPVVYSKNETCLFLRVRTSYPPSGKLEAYKVAVNKHKSEEFNVTGAQCRIWPEYHCLTLVNGVQKGGINQLEVSAKNFQTDYGSSEELSAEAKEGPSEPPNRLKYLWRSSELWISWNHPNVTNGKLQRFVLTIDKQNFTTNVTEDVPSYRFVRAGYKCETWFNISVSGEGQYRGNSAQLAVYVPPEIVYSQLENSDFSHIHNCNYEFVYVIGINESLTAADISNKKKLGDLLTQKAGEDFRGVGNFTRSDFEAMKHKEKLEAFRSAWRTTLIVFANKCHNKEAVCGSSDDGITAILVGSCVTIVLVIISTAILAFWFVRYNKKKIKLQMEQEYVPLYRVSINQNMDKDLTIEQFKVYMNEIEMDELEVSFLQVSKKASSKSSDRAEEETMKNRYKGIWPYDDTRVVLKTLDDEPNSDYINASYVKSFNGNNMFIAAQGPTPAAFDDFWRMVMEANVEYILMVTLLVENFKKMCDQYWPDLGIPMEYGNISVACIEESDITICIRQRIFQLKNCATGSIRKVIQWHYLSWPDKSVPTNTRSLLPLLRLLAKLDVTSPPVVVHCSAGVGRTGTLILCSYVLQQAEKGCISFTKALQKIREGRPFLVSRFVQFRMAHVLVKEYLFGVDTETLVDHRFRKAVCDLLASNTEMDKKFQEFKKYTYLPPDRIDAKSYVSVDYGASEEKFLILASNCSDLWSVAEDKNASLIIVINGELQTNSFRIDEKTVEETDTFTKETCKINFGFTERKVETYFFKHWDKNANEPDVKEFVKLYEVANSYENRGPIFVCCKNGIDDSGLYVAMFLLLRKMRVEKVCDVCYVLYSLMTLHSYYRPKKMTFRILYEIAEQYVDSLPIKY